ncbi:uncharacterized protein LOC111390551 [Olea europaea var. sylvestris]|uniref:uncharacterized protein LOC111390551 n=1 Tax=Olea europaea var. sylvestris TaxID=158386 RepID=UPI000C1D8BCD|nr:uncharacterized protein LOC111390551 [Olea europaea var. sylvestris]
MGSSVIPFEDLNQYPDSTSSSSRILPKIEPKLEPIDEHSPFFTTPSDPNLRSKFHRISELFENAFTYPDSSTNIIPVKNSEIQLSNFAISTQGACQYIRRRSSILVSVTDLQLENRRHFRDLIRLTRMLYDCLWVFFIVEDEMLEK